MKIRQYLKLFLPFSFIISIIVLYSISQTRDFIDSLIFDIFHQNTYVSKQETIEKILKNYPVISNQKLPKHFKEYSKSNKSKYKNILSGSRYFLIPKKEVYRKVVGNIRIKDLISKDKYYRKSTYFSSDTLIWGIDKRILFKVLALQNELTKKGFDRDAFRVVNGHRHPHYNEIVGGASKSRHIKGEAVDMVIKDINLDGKYTDEDKQIVIDICEKKIIKNGGGIGKYPGTRTVHIDVRGHRARWDSY